jgi:hypothetical protein
MFNNPCGVAVDSAGNVYVADYGNHRIRKITTSGATVTVSTLAGSGTFGYTDGAGTIAQFFNPRGVAVDSAGNVYVADTLSHRIRKITPGGVVSTFAGTETAGTVKYGYADGLRTDAQFFNPSGVAVDSAGNVYVGDMGNHLIRKITPAGTVSRQGRQCTCQPGQFWDFARKQCTTQCPVATYADSASKTCQPCPANKTSVAGSTNVSQCVCSYASPYWSGISCMQQLNPTATVTVSGSGITTRYVNQYVIHEFTQAASFVVQSSIIANILLVGGGAGGTYDGKPGNGGAVTTLSNQTLTNGTYNITIGAGGGPNTTGGCTFFSK